MSSEIKGAFLCVFGGVCWGLSGSMGQYLFTGAILFVYCLIRYGKNTFRPVSNKTDIWQLIVYGLLGVSCSQL